MYVIAKTTRSYQCSCSFHVSHIATTKSTTGAIVTIPVMVRWRRSSAHAATSPEVGAGGAAGAASAIREALTAMTLEPSSGGWVVGFRYAVRPHRPAAPPARPCAALAAL